ncbi:MAG: cation diffusion facilitator family transporter [Sphaerochaeta sp.]|jgi:cation diffusion facilitator family transporter|uniref:cation diffusion facilitator family transporter n=1 Tax=Sphaerochaeta sp. TaxID=1972642 RepID=UPI00261E501E|nr:cation diffusion facilitator family transporter [Sphaerochaeta sp.]MCK9598238.1 cation diffusion facilitator family transporter [Sphaerochaeta sp.]MDX9824711.1 cation diffusion facilitator family transporter [Sphaerochaeta sp.]
MKQNLALRVSRINIFNNIVLAVSKIGIGVVAHSAALLNDGVNNAGDVISSVIASVGIAAAGKDSDAEHQYGHERLESVAAILLSGIIMVVGMGLLVDGVSSIIKGSYLNRPIPGVLAVIAAIISIVVKEIMFLYTRWAAKKTRSSALLASSWDSQSDVLATTGGLIGIVFARMGYPIADSIAAIIIALFIFRVGVQVFRDGTDQMVDHACEEETVQQIRSVILDQEGVRGLDLLRTRTFGSRCYVDVEISADGLQSLVDAHSIAERVHHAIEKNFPQVKHCMVHVNPSKKKQ